MTHDDLVQLARVRLANLRRDLYVPGDPKAWIARVFLVGGIPQADTMSVPVADADGLAHTVSAMLDGNPALLYARIEGDDGAVIYERFNLAPATAISGVVGTLGEADGDNRRETAIGLIAHTIDFVRKHHMLIDADLAVLLADAAARLQQGA